MLSFILLGLQLVVTVVIGIYFFVQLRQQRQQKQPAARREGSREMEKIARMRSIHLTEPLSERVRPARFEDIIGQQDGIRSLEAILCGPNPQHVIIYGPPGIGKTCAARLVLEAAKQTKGTPFAQGAPFIEMDATCVRFDERAIADPLIGSVHDPIYQGAGPLGIQGVPQPKPGAVSKAHGGILFLDEIGELHPVQMNKLLKVLEDRKVFFESAYYNAEDSSVPRYIHDIFKNGMPADFRLVAATTRSPNDLPPALRSRCMEIYFRALEPHEVAQIAAGAALRAGFGMESSEAQMVGRYASCGRDAVNIVQMAAGVSQLDERKDITRGDIEWVVDSGHYAVRPDQNAAKEDAVGYVHGLAVYGCHQGTVMDIEAVADPGTGKVTVTGIAEEEEMGSDGHRIRRRSMASASAQNVMTLLRRMNYDVDHYDLHINFPGGTPVDGPSAGVAMAIAAISAITKQSVNGELAMTGEIGVHGKVLPVGGVPSKVEAALRSGLKRVLVPQDNYLERFNDIGIEVIPVRTINEALTYAFTQSKGKQIAETYTADESLVAQGAFAAPACKTNANLV